MDILGNTAISIFQMFIIMIVGFIAAKKDVCSPIGNKKISELLLDVVSPLLIFTSYQSEFSLDKLQDLSIVMLFTFCFMVMAIIFSRIVIRSKGDEKVYNVERMSLMYTNCGNIGIPLMLALFGTEGVFLCTGFLTVFNIICWSYGVAMLKGSITKKDIMRIFKGPNMIAIILGLITYVINFRLPTILLSPLQMIASMVTPLAMIVVGATLANSSFSELFGKRRSYYIVFLHNIVLPFIAILIYRLFIIRFFNIPTTLWIVSLIGFSCPVGSTTPMFALRFDKDGNYASTLLSLSTVFSIMTIPLMILIDSFF